MLEKASDTKSTLQGFIAFIGLNEKNADRAWSQLEAHEALLAGFPGRTLRHLVAQSPLLQSAEGFEKATGMSIRTLQRRNNEADKPLSPVQSGRIWTFAMVLTRATTLLGSQKAAEEWLTQPAMALNQQCPLDLLASPAGVSLVEDLLGRLEYGVYA